LADLEFLFHPQSVAVVGASSSSERLKGGDFFLKSLKDYGFKGKLYPINPRASEIMGLKAYPSVRDVPGSVEYVISCIPASETPQLVKDCVAKGVKAIALFTSGFSEAGEEGSQLEQEIVNLARQGGVRIIGPNCMGIYCPNAGLSYDPGFSKEAGCVGLLSQSGGLSIELVFEGGLRGIHFSKVISYGNAADLNEADLLEYFSQDAETKIIAAYIEGIRQGQRFLKALTKAAEEKPVIMFKGGRTKAGTRAVASHTGALAGNEAIWDTLCRQAGVVRVYSLEEMADLIVTFLYLRPLRGRRVGIISIGGGAAVQLTDVCTSNSLMVPHFSPKTRRRLERFNPQAGTSLHNPVDTLFPFQYLSDLLETIRVIDASKEVDLLLIYMTLAYFLLRQKFEVAEEVIKATIKASNTFDMPIALVLRTGGTAENWKMAFELQQMCSNARLPVYPSNERAAYAIGKFIRYHEVR